MHTDVHLIRLHGAGLYVQKIGGQPEIQPLGDRQITGICIGAVVQICCDLPQLLGDFLLRFPGNAALDLLSRTGVIAYGVSCLPI